MGEKRKLTDLEYEVLISEVQRRPPLWNDRLSDFKNSVVTKTLWEEVGKELNCSGEECKKKWKNLKDTFRRKMQAQQLKSAGSFVSSPTKKWKFTNLMEFTRDIIVPGSMAGNLRSPSVGEEEEEEDSTIDAEDLEPIQQLYTVPSCSEDDERFPRPHRSVRKIRKKEHLEMRMMELEEKKIDAILNMGKHAENNMGDDHHFFLSLLPYVARLDHLEKLQLRSKIQNCVLEAVREHEAR